MRVGCQKLVVDGKEWKWNEEKSDFSENSTIFKKLNKKAETEDETGIDKGHEKGNELGIVKKDEDLWNIATWNVRGSAGKGNELIGEFERENLDILGITETKKKGSGEMEMERGHLLIYKGVSGDSRSKVGVGCIINKNIKDI